MRAGRYVPGQRLVEADLMAEFGVGRGAVREALGRLGAEGLVETEAHRGARVRRLSREDFAELFAMIEVLEGLTARQAAACAPASAAPSALAAAFASLRVADVEGSFAETLTANSAFHREIAELAGNRRLLVTLEQLWLSTSIAHVWRVVPRGHVETARLSVAREHKSIFEAIAGGDAPGAERAMRHHILARSQLVLTLPKSAFD